MAGNWLKFTWDLTGLPENLDATRAPLLVRAAEKDEESSVLKVMTSAFSMDTGWADITNTMVHNLTERVHAIFSEKEIPCVVLQYGNRVIGCSAYRIEPAPHETHLVTGPCILHEYRCRGYGTNLLGASLLALQKAGLKTGTGTARTRTAAARFLYPKFGSVSAPWTSDLDTPPKLAA